MTDKVTNLFGRAAPVTLVMSVLDAGSYLLDVLGTIETQRRIPAELLIADRGSTDNTLHLLHSWAPPSGMIFKLLEIPGASVSMARNVAIESATYENIAVTDGDVRLQPEWLAALSAALIEGAQAVAGVVQPSGATPLERAIGLVQLPLAEQIDRATFLPSATSMAFTKSVWDGVGGYPEWLRSGQDGVFAAALRLGGTAIVLVPGAVATWSPRQNLPDYLIGCFRTANASGRAALVDRAAVVRLVAGASAMLALSTSRPAKVLALGGVGMYLTPYLRRVRTAPDRRSDRSMLGLVATICLAVGGDGARLVGYVTGRATALLTDGEFPMLGRRKPAAFPGRLDSRTPTDPPAEGLLDPRAQPVSR